MTDSNNHAHANDKLEMHTDNLVDSNIDKIAELFPNCITESQNEQGELERAIDFELLKQELSHQVVDGSQERYRLDWVGKRQAILEANTPIAKTLRPVREESVNFDSTENLFIEGDNLDALKLLQESYLGKVKMIYIDPPYNTGKDFIYDDDFSENTQDFLQRSEQIDEDGNRLVANKDTNGRFHSDWLTMMYSRLKLARNLLSDDGVIFISIDDNEVHNLRKICDEVFGWHNFIANFAWKRKKEISSDSRNIATQGEYILCFSKKDAQLKFEPLSKEYLSKSYKEANVQFNLGKWRPVPITVSKGLSGGGYEYEITTPSGVKHKRLWAYPKKSYLKLVENNRVYFGKNNDGIPQKIIYANESKGQPTTNYWDDVATNKEGKKLILDLFQSNYFDTPKPINLLNKILNLIIEKNDLILDFFAGSATTAHAVMDLNAQDGGKRKFIMVQLPEVTDEKSEAHKAGYSTIAEISKERIRRAGQKIVADNADKEGIENLDIGFRVLKIDSTNMKDVYYRPDEYSQKMLMQMESNIEDDRTAEDLLFQVMLDWGVSLDLPIVSQNIQEQNVYFVGGNSLVASFEVINADMIDDIAKLAPLKFVSCERAIQKDQDKSNIKERFRQLSPNTEVKFI